RGPSSHPPGGPLRQRTPKEPDASTLRPPPNRNPPCLLSPCLLSTGRLLRPAAGGQSERGRQPRQNSNRLQPGHEGTRPAAGQPRRIAAAPQTAGRPRHPPPVPA